MRFSAAFALVAAGVASAASTTTTAASSSSTCAAMNIVDACLATTGTTLDNCAPNDWSCMCSAQQAVVTCYNNCPGDPDAITAEQQETVWCNAAAQFSTSTTAATYKASSTASAGSASGSSPSDTAASSTASASASASAKSNAAAGLVMPVSGLMAVALGFIGL